MEITLTSREAELLKETVKRGISGMMLEIARTDNREMRDGLKGQEEILESILRKLSAAERKVA